MTLQYTTVDRVLDILPSLRDVATLTSAHIHTFASDAEAEVDAQLSRLYTVPVPGGPPLLTAVATDIAIYRILSRRIFTAERLKDSPWPAVFREAREQLEKLASGKTTLVDSAGTIIAGSTTVAEVTSNTRGYLQTFADGVAVLDAGVDPNKVDDQYNERTR